MPMRGSDVSFYADREEMLGLLEDFNGIGTLAYTETLSTVNMPLLRLEDATQMMEFLRSRPLGHTKLFLAHDQNLALTVEESVQTDGSGTKLSVWSYNFDSVVIRLGGQIYGQRILVATSINTTGESERSRQLFAQFKKRVRKKARRVGRFYVLPGALDKLCSGWRLTPEPQYSPSEDLRPPPECETGGSTTGAIALGENPGS